VSPRGLLIVSWASEEDDRAAEEATDARRIKAGALCDWEPLDLTAAADDDDADADGIGAKPCTCTEPKGPTATVARKNVTTDAINFIVLCSSIVNVTMALRHSITATQGACYPKDPIRRQSYGRYRWRPVYWLPARRPVTMHYPPR
jgi:hypothetical protein